MSKIQHNLVTWHENKRMIPKYQKYQNSKKHHSGEIWTIHLLRIRLSLEKVKIVCYNNDLTSEDTTENTSEKTEFRR